MIPTLRTTLSVKGHRPRVGHLDCHEVLYVFGALNLVTGRLTTRLVERPKQARRRAPSKPRSWQQGFARHRREIARASPAAQYPRVVLVIDRASWHQGPVITQMLAACPHVEWSPLPSYSPQLQVIERFWKVLRRRATHHRLCRTMAHLKQALRNSLCYDQTLKHRVLTVMQSPRNRTKSAIA
jgi:hypothetical protein